jgi:hypothetical protein
MISRKSERIGWKSTFSESLYGLTVAQGVSLANLSPQRPGFDSKPIHMRSEASRLIECIFSGRKRRWVKPNEMVVKCKCEGVKCQ